jgi:hypothetical protein
MEKQIAQMEDQAHRPRYFPAPLSKLNRPTASNKNPAGQRCISAGLPASDTQNDTLYSDQPGRRRVTRDLRLVGRIEFLSAYFSGES